MRFQDFLKSVFKNTIATIKFAVNQGDNAGDGIRPILFTSYLDPDIETFESLGFKFEKTNIPYTMKVTLPKGWCISHCIGNRDDRHHHFLYDEKNRFRVIYKYYVSIIDGPQGFAFLNIRYCIDEEDVGKKRDKRKCLYIRDVAYPQKKLIIGEYADSDGSEEYNKILEKAESYLNENYPDWKNPLKYWD